MDTWITYALIAWGAINAFSRLLTDAQWAALPKWLQGLIGLSRALGPDTAKAYKKGADFVSGAAQSFRGAPTLPLFVLALALGGCPSGKAEYPRHVARGSVLAVAYGVQLLDHACAVKAREIAGEEADLPEPPVPTTLKDVPALPLVRTATTGAKLAKAIDLAKKCDAGYQVARSGLLAAADAVDAWDSADRGAIGCGVVQGVEGLKEIANVCTAAGIKLPPAVDDAFAAGQFILSITGAECKR